MPSIISETSDVTNETSVAISGISEVTSETSVATSETSVVASETPVATYGISVTTFETSLTTNETPVAVLSIDFSLFKHKKKSMNKVIINIEEVVDETISSVVDATIRGCTDNANFSIVAPLQALVVAKRAYDPSLAACMHGDEAATSLKNKNKAIMVDAYRVVAVQINVQAAGDRVKALSSGCKMEGEGLHQVMGEVVGFHVKTTSIAGTFEVSVQKPTAFTTHGTVFAYWDPELGPTPSDKNKWFHRQSNGHSLTLAGFTPGVTYPFSAAYKGLDTDPLIWSAITNKMAGD